MSTPHSTTEGHGTDRSKPGKSKRRGRLFSFRSRQPDHKEAAAGPRPSVDPSPSAGQGGLWGHVDTHDDDSHAQALIDSLTPRPVTQERVAAELSSRGYTFLDSQDSLYGQWNDNDFLFWINGEHQETFQIRGQWKGKINEHSRLAAFQASHDWNRDTLFPKTYIRQGRDITSENESDEGLTVYAEMSTDIRCGLTDDQLSDIVTWGLDTSLEFFSTLDGIMGDDAGIN